jgi:hypothetical protein
VIVGIHPTGSKLDTVGRCPAAAALPQVESFNEDDKAPARGIGVHRFLELCVEVGRDAALEQVDEAWRPLCTEIDTAKLARELSCSTEVALAYNFVADTARRLHTIGDRRAYEIDPSCEVAARLDLIGVAESAVLVGDYKGPHAWLPRPEDSYQLGVGAVAAARLFGRSRAHVEYIRILDDGKPLRFDADLDVFGLEAAAERIRGAMQAVALVRQVVDAGRVPNVSEGPWCRYCNARASCPAKTATIRQLVLDTQPIPHLTPLTPESAKRAYAMLAPLKAALKDVEGALYAYAKLDPIHVRTEEDGSERWFGELARAGNDQVDGPIAHKVLTQLYSGEVANAAVTFETTKTAIGAAVRAALPAGDKLAPALRAVYATIDELGGIANPKTVTTTEYTISPAGDAKARKRKAS